MSNADKVLAEARKWLGHSERKPQLDNVGTGNPPTYSEGSWIVNKCWQEGGYSSPQPWCGCFVIFVANRCGYKAYQPTSKGGVGHGYTGTTYSEAQKRGWLKSKPVPAALLIRNGKHVGFVDKVYSDGTYSTIEGNSGDAVSARRRSAADGYSFIVPPDLGSASAESVVTMYAFERLDIKTYGGWATKEARDGQLAKFKAANPDYWTRAIKTTKKSPYAFEAGPPGTYGTPKQYGGWSDKATRDRIHGEFQQANPNVPTRIFSYKKTQSGPPPPAPPASSGPDKTT